MGISIDENNVVVITSTFFSEELTKQATEFANLGRKELRNAKEDVKAFRAHFKEAYLAKDAELKVSVEQKVNEAKETKLKTINEIETTRLENLKAAEEKFNSEHHGVEPTKEEKKAYNNIVKGIEIVAKRAKIKAKNDYEDAYKAAKITRFDLISEYNDINKLLGRNPTFIDSFKASHFENSANMSVRHMLTNKKTWINLVPLFMLIVIIIAYFIGKTVNNYAGDLGDVINNGIFVAVVATGAVYIYSQGGFDMSLGASALTCAAIAALTWNATHNIFLTIVLAIAIGAGLGIINAILATMLNLPVMVMTLTMMNILAAINEQMIQNPIYPDEGLLTLYINGKNQSWIIYAAILLGFFIICSLIFNYTKIGRRNKFIGSNKTAAKFNGINLMVAGIISFGISGLGLGLCGLIFASSKSGGGQFTANTVLGQVGLNVVIAIIFGGMTTSGGPKSKVSCAIIGAFFSVFLDEFFAAISTPAFAVGDYCYMVKGIIFIIVALANMWDTRGKMLASGGSIQ